MNINKKIEKELNKEFRKKGYTWQDIDELNCWFIRTMQKMLKEFRDTTRIIPINLVIEIIGEEQAMKNNDNENFNVWTDILDIMIFLFLDADIETCSIKNKYEEELIKTIREFYKKIWEKNNVKKKDREIDEELFIKKCVITYAQQEAFFQMKIIRKYMIYFGMKRKRL